MPAGLPRVIYSGYVPPPEQGPHRSGKRMYIGTAGSVAFACVAQDLAQAVGYVEQEMIAKFPNVAGLESLLVSAIKEVGAGELPAVVEIEGV